MKKVLSVLLISIFCLTLSGCGADVKGILPSSGTKITCTKTTTEDNATTNEKIVVTFKNNIFNSIVGTTKITYQNEEEAKTYNSFMSIATTMLQGYGFTASSVTEGKDIIMNYSGDIKTIIAKIKTSGADTNLGYDETTTKEDYINSMTTDGYICK